MAWYNIIPFCDYPSSIERMNGVGYCAVTRALRVAQIMRSIFLYKDEKVSGRHYKQIHFVSGVSRAEIQDQLKRGQEEANNTGLVRFILPAVLASLDPEKPVSTATIDLASLPDGFNLDEEMKWYISGLAIAFGVDYQEFAPLPGGNIGSSSQSMILHRKTSGKNPAVFMRTLVEGLTNYGALPRNVQMTFNDKDEQEELERQEVRTKALEEAAISARAGILSPDAIRRDLVRRGIYTEETIRGIPADYGIDILSRNNQVQGRTGGNTILEDAGRQDTGTPGTGNEGPQLQKSKAKEIVLNLPDVHLTLPETPPPTVIVKEQTPPNVVVNMPEQKPPIVNVTVPTQPPPTVNVAAPSVAVNTPRIKKETQTVKRDAKGDITSTETQIEYEQEGKGGKNG